MRVAGIILVMMRAWLPTWNQCLALLFVGAACSLYGQILHEGHSHNDFRRKAPLHKALDHGFHSVEADVHLHKGELVVAHNGFLLSRKPTLERLYLRPLHALAQLQGMGSVHADGTPGFVLYIDIKQGCPDVLDTLLAQLEHYADMLTQWDHGQERLGAVTIIVGACGREQELLSRERRLFQFDGRHHHIGGPYDASVVPRIGMPLRRITRWRGRGAMDPAELDLLRSTVAQAKEEGRQIRFWAATNKTHVWQLLLDEGVDVINVDRIGRFASYMQRTNEQ
jgi:glycerophosphoryl diester phosphodiesterase